MEAHAFDATAANRLSSTFVIIVADCNADGPVVSIDGVDVSGGSHEATVGQSVTLSCNTMTAVWKKGSVTITNTDNSSRVFVMSSSTETILQFSLFRTTDGETYTCQFNSTFRTSVTLSECAIVLSSMN